MSTTEPTPSDAKEIQETSFATSLRSDLRLFGHCLLALSEGFFFPFGGTWAELIYGRRNHEK